MNLKREANELIGNSQCSLVTLDLRARRAFIVLACRAGDLMDTIATYVEDRNDRENKQAGGNENPSGPTS